ncbi:MAG: TolC family protein [Pseudomonadales bacterium]
MILLLIASLQVAGGDSIPRVTLADALRLSLRIDPTYVSASGGVDNAAWQKRSTRSRFFVPSLALQTTVTEFSTEIFNVGTGQQSSRIVEARFEASYNLFSGLGKFYDAKRASAEFESAMASETQARFGSFFQTEADYYNVLAEQELVRVADDRVGRAEEQLVIARARVISGATVQTDSLQLLLELTQARVDLLRERSSLKIARIQLGRRVGHPGPVDAVPLDAFPGPQLPISEEEAVREALNHGPDYRVAIANEKAAAAALKAQRGAYLPRVDLFAQATGFDDGFFPDATTRVLWGINVRLPLWDGGQREIEVTRARVNRDVARAILEDKRLAVGRDVALAYEAYNTAHAATTLAGSAVIVAEENLRVNEIRYRSGATTILDLLTAQVSLTEAEAGLVQARQTTRLALAALEALVGRRLYNDERSAQ